MKTSVCLGYFVTKRLFWEVFKFTSKKFNQELYFVLKSRMILLTKAFLFQKYNCENLSHGKRFEFLFLSDSIETSGHNIIIDLLKSFLRIPEWTCLFSLKSKDFEREGLDSLSSMVVAKTQNYELDWNIQNFKASFPTQDVKWWQRNIGYRMNILARFFNLSATQSGRLRSVIERSRIFEF